MNILMILLIQAADVGAKIPIPFAPVKGDSMSVSERVIGSQSDSECGKCGSRDETRSATWSIEEVAGSAPVRIAYRYGEARNRISDQVTTAGANRRDERSPFSGKTFVWTREADGSELFKPDGIRADGPALAELLRPDRWTFLLPPEPVAPGSEWKARSDRFCGNLELVLQLGQVSKVGDRRCATISIRGAEHTDGAAKGRKWKTRGSASGSMVVWVERGYLLSMNVKFRQSDEERATDMPEMGTMKDSSEWTWDYRASPVK